MEQFIAYLNHLVVLSEVDKDFIRQTLRLKHFKKGEFILQNGQISKAFYFNLSGFVRLFYNKITEENTAYFYPENTFISAYESFVRQQPAKFNFQAMENTALIEITKEAAAKLLSYSSKFDILARIIMEEELIMNQKIIAALLTMTNEERYLNLLEENPTIFQRVSQHYIASYLGMKPESLSRIKKRIYTKKS